MRAVTRFYSVQANLRVNPVQDLQSAKTLQILLNDDYATVTYEKLNHNIYDLIHTSIPDKYQGQGLGKIFAERIFDYFSTNDKKFVLTCEFLQKALQKHGNKYDDYIAKL